MPIIAKKPVDLSLDPTIPTEFPKVIKAVCMYCKNPAKNEDKEYHIQLVEESAGLFNVHSQNGKRGSKLVQRQAFPAPFANKWNATNEYNDLESSKEKRGYKKINLESLGGIYREMLRCGLDRAGVDLYMNKRGKFISLVEYTKTSSDANIDHEAVVRSYNNVTAAKSALLEMGIGQVADPGLVIEGLSIVSQMLIKNKLSDMDVFLGYRDAAGEVYRGVPAQYSQSERPGFTY